jgi:hypothetical protein
MCTVKALRKLCGSNYKVINFIQLALVSEITEIPDPVTDTDTFRTIEDDITMVATKTFKRIDFAKGSGKFIEVLKGTPDTTTSVETTIQGFYPEANAQASEAVNGMIGAELIAIVHYSDGTRRLVGSLTNPVMTAKMDEDSSKGGYDIELKWEGDAKSPYYTGVIAS